MIETQALSRSLGYALDSPPTHREHIGSFKSIVDLSQDLGNHLKSFLTGKEIACLNATCPKLNYTSWLSAQRIKEHQFIPVMRKRLSTPANKNYIDLLMIELYISIKDYKEALELTKDLEKKRDFKLLFQAYEHIITKQIEESCLKSAATTFSVYTEHSKQNPAPSGLIEYKVNHCPEKLERMLNYFRNYFEAVDHLSFRGVNEYVQVLCEKAKLVSKKEALDLIECAFSFNQTYIHYYKICLHEIETLIEMGEHETALEFLNRYERLAPDNERLGQLMIEAKLKINFIEAFNTYKKFPSTDSFYSLSDASPSEEMTLTLLKIWKEGSHKKASSEDKEYAYNEMTRVVKGEPLENVEEITSKCHNVDLCFDMLIFCAKQLGKKNKQQTAIKYLKKAESLVYLSHRPLREKAKAFTFLQTSREVTS